MWKIPAKVPAPAGEIAVINASFMQNPGESTGTRRGKRRDYFEQIPTVSIQTYAFSQFVEMYANVIFTP